MFTLVLFAISGGYPLDRMPWFLFKNKMKCCVLESTMAALSKGLIARLRFSGFKSEVDPVFVRR